MYWLLLSTFLFTINNILWKKYLSVQLTFKLVFVRAIFTSICFLLLYFFLEGNLLNEIQSPDYYLIIIACLFGAIGLYCLIQFLKQGALNYMGYYNFFGIAITGLYTLIFKQEQLKNIYFLSGLALIVLGYIFFLIITQSKNGDSNNKNKDHFLLIAMTLAFNFSVITQSLAIEKFSFVTVAFSQEVVVLSMAGLIVLLQNNTKEKIYDDKLYA